MIDRSQDARHSESPSGLLAKRSPSCLELASRNPSWQRSCATATTDRTYDRNRFDPYSAPNLASRGPSTYGTRSGARPRWFERPCALHRMMKDHASPAGVTRSFLSQSSEFPRRPVIVPAGRITRSRPGADCIGPPAGTALAPLSGVPSAEGVLHRARFDVACVTERGTDVKVVTLARTQNTTSGDRGRRSFPPNLPVLRFRHSSNPHPSSRDTRAGAFAPLARLVV